METLYRRIRGDLGLSRPYVRRTVLPEWWDDAAAEVPAGLGEAVILLSRHLGLDPKSLRGEGPITPAAPLRVKLKRAKSANGRDVTVAQQLAVQVARLAALGVREPVTPLPASGRELREQILVDGAPWVGLDALVDLCWARGVAVLHVARFPKGLARMHGLAVKAGGRSVVVLSWERTSPAWLLFVLAHEVGHLALGHVDEDSVLVDEAVDRESADAEERQANDYALELLCGSRDTRFEPVGHWPKADALAREAGRLGRAHRIDPGHVVLNYAHTMGRAFYPVGQAALKVLETGRDGPDAIRQRLAARLDWERLPAESSEFVLRMTGAARPR